MGETEGAWGFGGRFSLNFVGNVTHWESSQWSSVTLVKSFRASGIRNLNLFVHGLRLKVCQSSQHTPWKMPLVG